MATCVLFRNSGNVMYENEAVILSNGTFLR